jgi:hypothetical protein
MHPEGWPRSHLTVTPTFSMSFVRTHFCVVVARWCLRASCSIDSRPLKKAAAWVEYPVDAAPKVQRHQKRMA